MSGAFNTQSMNRRYRHFCPYLAGAIAETCREMTISDFGAGIGFYVNYLRAVGCWAIGYDGTPDISDQTDGVVQYADLSKPAMLPITNAVISIEVGEHIPQQYESAFIDNLCRHATNVIIVSWARIGQRGRNHVNCQNPETLIPKFEERLWALDWPCTELSRMMAGKPWDSKLLIMRRKGVIG